jgi:hypothetical protein
MESVAVPYVYISRDKKIIEDYLTNKNPSSKDLLKLATGDKSFISFTSEFRFTNANNRSIIAMLDLLDSDRSFERFFLEDSLLLNTGYGIVYYIAFGIGSGTSPIHSMTLTNILHKDDSNSARRLTMEFVTGDGGSPFDPSKYNISSNNELNTDHIKVQLLSEAITKYPQGRMFGTYGKYLTSTLNEIYNESIQKIVKGKTGKPCIVLLPSLEYHVKPIPLREGDFLSILIPDFCRKETAKVTEYFSELGFKVMPTVIKKKVKYREARTLFKKTKIETTVDASGPIYVAVDLPKDTYPDRTLDNYFDFIFKQLNDNSSYIFEKESFWLTDPIIIELLANVNDGVVFPQLKTKYGLAQEVLVVGDFRTINSILYGAENNVLLSKLTSNINEEKNENSPKKIESFLPNLKYLKELNVGEERLYKKTWEYYTKLLSSKNDTSTFRSLFQDNSLIKTYVTNALGTDFEESLIQEAIDTVPIFRYNTKNSNVLSLSLEKDNQFFAALLQTYIELSKIKEDIINEYATYNFDFDINPWSLDKSTPFYEEKPLVNFDSAIRKKEDIEKYVLSKYNNLAFTAKVKTLPLFTFSTPSIVGTGVVGLIGNGLKVTGKYSIETTALDRLYTGLWTIMGYRHVISKGDVSSEFTLIRNNNYLFKSSFLEEQLDGNS